MTRSVALGATSAFVLAAAFCAAVPSTFGQAAPAAPATDTAVAIDDELIELDPFTVSADDETVGYAVKDTLAGTRIRTEMKDIASSLVVVNKQLMTDIGATNSDTLLQYTGNTEVGGVRGNFLGGSYPSSSDGYGQNASLLRPNNNTRVRGLDSADNTRDFFMTEIPWDSYIVDRVDIQRGPNSMLFGVGSPAGIINSSVNQPSFATGYTFENKVDNWGSLRNSIDVNQVIVSKTLAVRIAGLHDDKKFEQDPAFERTSRVFGAIRFEPKLIKGGVTKILANFEHGRIRANRPRTLAPEDNISLWFGNMNKMSFNAGTQSPDSDANKLIPYTNGVTIGRQYWPGTVGYYGDVYGNQAMSYMTPMASDNFGIDSSGAVDSAIGGLLFTRPYAIAGYKTYLGQLSDKTNSDYRDGAGYYSTKSLTDASIFNFYEELIDGDNKREWQDWNAYNINLTQTFLDNRLGLNFVYDVQHYKDGQESLFNGGGAYALSVDINTHLIDGSVNPNYGRPYVAGATEFGGNDSKIDRDSWRFTPYAELRFDDFMEKSWVTRVFGRHLITGLLSQDTKEQRDRQYALDMATTDYAEYTGQTAARGGHISAYNWMAYLGDSLANASTAAGANIDRIHGQITSPATASVRYFDSHWDSAVNPADPYTYTDANGKVVADSTQSENPDNYVGWTNYNVNFRSVARGDKEDLIWGDSLKRNQIESHGFTWQGYMLDECFVPVFGWRKDTVKMRKGEDATDALGMVDGSYDYDPKRDLKQSGISKSWGGVLHLPKFISSKLPGNTSISVFYNRSSNFKADEPRQDVFGTMIDNARGKTKEYGFAVTTLNDKLSLKVNWYETKLSNATLPYGTGFSYEQYCYPAWYIAHAAKVSAVADGRINQDWWDYLDADTGADYRDRILAAAKAFPLDQNFFNSYGNEFAGIDVAKFKNGDFVGAWNNGFILANNDRVDPQPGTSTVQRVGTADSTSKGIEFDLSAQIIPNWNVSINVAKVKAQYDSISPTITKFMDDMEAFLNTDAGLLRMWGDSWADGTFRKQWDLNVGSKYRTLLAYVGNSAPDIAPWRANIVTNYTFQNGFLKNVNVGAGYRWEDKKILGYGLSLNPDTNTYTPDTDKPLKGDSTDHVDLWVGYSRKLTDKIDWRIQLNLRNVGESHHLEAASLNPDGAVALARIVEGTTWQLSNTFSF